MAGSRMKEVLEGREGNYLIPFFWQYGGGAERIREEMDAVCRAGIRAVCVESRVHPDFLGPGWWQDMDVIMDEAVRRGMRVWVLDDAHFPTGWANGAAAENPWAGKRYLDCTHIDAVGPLAGHGFLVGPETGEELIAVTAGRKGEDGHSLSELVDLTDRVSDGMLFWDVPEGVWTVNVIRTTDRSTGRKGYLNLIDRDAAELLLRTVYEPHYAHYGKFFGKEFAGFFSDEPEIGNVLSEYGHDARIGLPRAALPWCGELRKRLERAFGPDFAVCLTGLWERTDTGYREARYRFMDAVTELYGKNFSGQIGGWCRARGVEYIGHVIEDNGCHSRLGLGTGHFFRALGGQDMSGIDVVLQQIRPGLEEGGFYNIGGKGQYDGRFFHYGLARMGVSLAYLDPKKRGRTMCEIFGAYGWTEGLKLMKWLADHMLVRGVNHFVPHAFSMKPFPDQDCPPHFYAHGLNPQYPYFQRLCAYMNRVSHLLQGGKPVSEAAVFYHAGAEWMGARDGFEVPGRTLSRHQISYLVLPEDALLAGEIADGALRTPAGECRLLVFPYCEYLPDGILDWCDRALEKGLRIVMDKRLPCYAGTGQPYRDPGITAAEDLDAFLDAAHPGELWLDAVCPGLRYYHYRQAGESYFLFFNEAVTETVDTKARLPLSGPAEGALYRYDAFENRLYRLPEEKEGAGVLRLRLVPGEAAVFCRADGAEGFPLWDSAPRREVLSVGGPWRIRRIRYDGKEFPAEEADRLFDRTGPEGDPRFSGRICYETDFDGGTLSECGEDLVLDCDEVWETMEVWLNGKPLGVRICAPYTLPVSAEALLPGRNHLRIDVCNTLVHALRDPMSATMPVEPSGLLGPVRFLGGNGHVL